MDRQGNLSGEQLNAYSTPEVKSRKRSASLGAETKSRSLTAFMAPARKIRDTPVSKKRMTDGRENTETTKVVAVPKYLDLFDERGIPPEIISHIMAFLPRKSLLDMALTCHRMKAIAFRFPKLWDNVILRRKPHNESWIHSIITRGVRSLKITECTVVRDMFHMPQEQKEEVGFNTFKPKFEELEISCLAGPMHADFFSGIFDRTTSLKNLSIERSVIELDMAEAIARNTHLEKLNMCTCRNVTADACRIIFESCKNIKELNLSSIDIPAQQFNELIQMLPRELKRLSLSNINNQYWTENTSRWLIERCPRLWELDISDVFGHDINHLLFLLHGLPNITHLHISRLRNIDRNELVRLPRTIIRLSAFSMVSREIIELLQHLNPKLQVNECPLIHIARFPMVQGNGNLRVPETEEPDDIRFFFVRPQADNNDWLTEE
ncbi:hypothetical protein QR680_001263 [Steinernema hermaphroditum]|uniref:F-box domain-containing protein n=1 Tax=Steinernema hermaphroditum TaxID=289476 RepID=A0AA39LF35_9BILA|nr:hypothetical protein QR680_001263 [Steinernema hermaphroditum]